MSAALLVDKVSWAPSRRAPQILHETSFVVQAGQVMGIVGPNGAGKTSLLRLIYGFNKPLTGSVSIAGESLNCMPPRAIARKVAAVLQEQPADFALTVREIVSLGRVPHRLGLATPGKRDAEVIGLAMDRLNLRSLADRSLATLSGGERQRVMVARALAQEPQVLVLDEPTNHLDIRHQLEVLQLIRDLGLTIVTSLHDLNLASDVCDQILMLKGGRPQGVGAPDEVLSDRIVSDTFQVTSRREQLSLSQKPHLTYQLSQN